MSDRSHAICEFDPDTMILRIDVAVAGTLESISPVVERIMKIVTEMGCVEGKEYEVEVSILEALANAVKHGCGGDPAKKVQVCVSCDENRGMLIVVRDPGEGFDPASLPSPLEAENLLASHGRGIFLISQFMDDVAFSRGGTEIRMRKK